MRRVELGINALAAAFGRAAGAIELAAAGRANLSTRAWVVAVTTVRRVELCVDALPVAFGGAPHTLELAAAGGADFVLSAGDVAAATMGAVELRVDADRAALARPSEAEKAARTE